MERDDMIKRLDAGEKAIDLSIEKWEDILEGTGFDDGGDNCACCYADGEYMNCSTCPIYKYDIEELGKIHFCGNLPDETDKEGIKKAIEHMKRVKQWMIEKGEYE